MLTNFTHAPCVCGAVNSRERIPVRGTLLVLLAWDHVQSQLHPSRDLDPPRHPLLNREDGITDQNDQ